MPPLNVLYDLASMRKTGALVDLTVECGGETFKVHRFVVCERSLVLQEACSLKTEGTEVVVRDDTFDAATMSRMLDFLYEDEYSTSITAELHGGDHGGLAAQSNPTKLDVLSHLFFHAIGEHYQVKDLSEFALEKFASTLATVSVDDFADLVGVIAANTEADTIHHTLQGVVLNRMDELARCDSFLQVLSCKRTQGASADEVTKEGAAKLGDTSVLAALGAKMFSVASERHLRVTLENDRLAERCEQATAQVEQLHKQLAKGMVTLRKGEETHNAALETIQALGERAKRAENELAEISETAALTDRTTEKLELLEKGIKELETKNADDKASVKTYVNAHRKAFEEKCKSFEEKIHKLKNDLNSAEAHDQKSKTHGNDRQIAHDKVSGLDQRPEKEAKEVESLMSEVARLKDELSRSKAENLEQADTIDKLQSAASQSASSSSSAWGSAGRRQYIIRRICHLANKLDKCGRCGAAFNAKLIWLENNLIDSLEKEVVLKCKGCDFWHTCFHHLN